MGKKKAQKTKELSVAIAEAQSAGDARNQQQTRHESQLQSPRRRGRPRKIFVKNESEEENKEQAADEAEQSSEEVGTIAVKYRSLSKRARTSERHELEKSSGHKQDKDKEQEASEPKLLDVAKKEGTVAGAKEVTKREPSSSRAKRKSKPRKSSSK